jgi:hypothetical protein
MGNHVRFTKKTIQTKDGVQHEWQPSASCSFRDGPEINRTTGRAGRVQIVINEGGDPFLLRRTSYRKMFKRGEYSPDPYEPQKLTFGEKFLELVRGAIMKLKESRQ